MSLPKMTTAVDNISKLDTRPNAVNGLTAEALKAEFDKGPGAIKAFLNDILIPALDASVTLDALGGVPESRTINGKPLSGDVTLDADDIPADDMETHHATVQAALDTVAMELQKTQQAAVPKTRKVAGKALDADITLQASDIRYTGSIGGVMYPDVQKAIDALEAEMPEKGGVVVVSLVNSSSGLIADKSVAEIYAAFVAGKSVVAHAGQEEYQLTEVTGSKAEFQTLDADSGRLVILTGSATGGADNWSISEEPVKAANVTVTNVQVGDTQVDNVAQALGLLSYGNPMDASASYLSSGQQTVAAWAGLAKSGSATEYMVPDGDYKIIDTYDYVYYVTIGRTAGTNYRSIVVRYCTDEGFVYLECYTVDSPGAVAINRLYFSTEEHMLTFNEGTNVILPPCDYPSDEGKVCMVSGGVPAWKKPSAPSVPHLLITSSGDLGSVSISTMEKDGEEIGDSSEWVNAVIETHNAGGVIDIAITGGNTHQLTLTEMSDDEVNLCCVDYVNPGMQQFTAIVVHIGPGSASVNINRTY